jgi:hypothetical protein
LWVERRKTVLFCTRSAFEIDGAGTNAKKRSRSGALVDVRDQMSMNLVPSPPPPESRSHNSA